MALKLYAVPASHPCAAVEVALRRKGLPYKRIDLPNGLHFPLQLARFGRHTVPGLTGDGIRVVGSRAIVRVLDALAPTPPLLPLDPAARARVEEAEAWGEEVLQAAARRLAWTLMPRVSSDVAASYLEGARLPVSAGLAARGLPLIAPFERRFNGVREERVREELRALPGWLDRVDALVADQVIGGAEPNAADLQILSSVRLYSTYGDLDGLLAGRTALRRARDLFPVYPGRIPAGTLPPGWLG